MRTALLPALPLLLVSACASPTDHGGELADSSWRFTAIDGAAPTSQKARLTFDRDRIGANIGCNGMGGPWRVENGRLIAGPLVQTQMYCEGPVWDQERAVSALLSAAPEFKVNGRRMEIKSSGHSAELQREP